jgi:hypothetical protein
MIRLEARLLSELHPVAPARARESFSPSAAPERESGNAPFSATSARDKLISKA